MATSPRSFVFCAAIGGALSFSASPAQAQITTGTERVQYVQLFAKDYAFVAPTVLEEGIVTFHLINQGSDVHQLSIVDIGTTHTIKQFFDAMRVNGTPPAWAVTVGQTKTIEPNSDAFVTIRLASGHYVYACMIPAKDGRSHVEKGMYNWVTVNVRTKPAPANVRTKPAPAAPAKKP